MQWRTEIENFNIPLEINHQDDLVFLGSCFSENIGSRFQERKFNTLVNPFGVSFNPISIASQLLTSNIDYSLSFDKDGELHNFLFQNSGVSNQDLLEFKQKVTSAKVVFLTLGTAYVHVHKETGCVVTNCHKQPSELFEKRLLSIDEIVTSLIKLKEVFPDQYFIYTVSPVRHTREGLVNNQLSKSVLRVAIDQLLGHKTLYFPSYEMVVDDLREYRFFEKDLIHPNEVAIDYIWEKVIGAFFDQGTINELKKIEQLISRCNHKLLNPDSEASKLFISNLKEDLISSQYDWSDELSKL